MDARQFVRLELDLGAPLGNESRAAVDLLAQISQILIDDLGCTLNDFRVAEHSAEEFLAKSRD